jgi:L-alanine-DL-glutamate epimerase-like enolase superfamily enzyme
MAETCHRRFAPHDCTGPAGVAAAVHMSLGQPNTLIQESVRASCRGWYNELVTAVPRIENVFCLSDARAAAGRRIAARGLQALGPYCAPLRRLR